MTVIEQLNNVFRMVFDDDSITIRRDMTADDIEGWDSFAHMSLITAIELAFGVTLADDEVVKLMNVGSIVDLIHSKMGGA